MIQFNGKYYKLTPEKSDLSCDGCAFLQRVNPKGDYGCFVPNWEHQFNDCKEKHVVYVETEVMEVEQQPCGISEGALFW